MARTVGADEATSLAPQQAVRGILVVVMWILLACTQTPEPVRAPDVLLVVLDTVRADRLSTYDHDRPTSRTVAVAG